MAGTQEIGKLIIRLRAETAEMKRELQESKSSIQSFASEAKKILTTIGIAFGAGMLINEFKQLIKYGIEYNSQVEQQVLGIGSLIAATGDVLDHEGKRLEGMEKLNAAMEISAELYEKLRLKAMATTATTPELVEAFQMMVAPGREANLTLEQMVNLSTDIVQAMKAMGLPLIQSRMEMRGLLTGEENLRMDLMQRLQISGEEIKKMREQGTLYDYLSQKLEVFRLSGEKQLGTWEGLTSTAKDFFGKFMGDVTKPIFQSIKSSVQDLMKDLVEVSDEGVNFKGVAKEMADQVKLSFTIIIEHFRNFKDEYLGLFALIGTILKGLNQAVGGLFTGMSLILSSATTVIYYFIKALDVLTGGSIPALSEGAEVLKKKMDESWDSTIKQTDALNKLIFGTEEYAEKTKKIPKPTAPPKPSGGLSAEQVKKEETAYENIIKKTSEYRESLIKLEDPIKADRMELERWIEEKTKDVPVTGRVTKGIQDLKISFEKLQIAIKEKESLEEYTKAFDKIKEKTEGLNIELLKLQDPLKATQVELDKQIQEMIKDAPPTAALASEIYKLQTAFKALKAAEAERESVKYKEADINREISEIQLQQKQYKITTEVALGKEISLNEQLLGTYQKQLENTKVGDERYGELQDKISGTRQKLNELNFELDKQNASFSQLSEYGLKKYAENLKTTMIESWENLIPNAIDNAGNAVKGFINNLREETMSASEALKTLATDFMDSMVDMAVEIGLVIAKMEILKALGYGTTGATGTTGGTGGTGGGWGSLLSGVVGIIGGLLQTGGQVKGPSGPDKVPIMATAGEWVIKESAAKYYGRDMMSAINSMRIPKSSLSFQSGGEVPAVVTSGSERGAKTEISVTNITDPRDIDRFIASAEGQRSMLNFISSKAGSIRKILK